MERACKEVGAGESNVRNVDFFCLSRVPERDHIELGIVGDDGEVFFPEELGKLLQPIMA